MPAKFGETGCRIFLPRLRERLIRETSNRWVEGVVGGKKGREDGDGLYSRAQKPVGALCRVEPINAGEAGVRHRWLLACLAILYFHTKKKKCHHAKIWCGFMIQSRSVVVLVHSFACFCTNYRRSGITW